ncbi:hypothetical protein WA158_001920 [Blastocystis sp. Blastoise]
MQQSSSFLKFSSGNHSKSPINKNPFLARQFQKPAALQQTFPHVQKDQVIKEDISNPVDVQQDTSTNQEETNLLITNEKDVDNSSAHNSDQYDQSFNRKNDMHIVDSDNNMSNSYVESSHLSSSVVSDNEGHHNSQDIHSISSEDSQLLSIFSKFRENITQYIESYKEQMEEIYKEECDLNQDMDQAKLSLEKEIQNQEDQIQNFALQAQAFQSVISNCFGNVIKQSP